MIEKKTVSLIAPSSAPKNKEWKKNFEILKSWGLKVDFPAYSLKPNFFHSHSDSKRALFLKQAFHKKSSSMVWMLRGGYGCQKLHAVFPQLPIKNSKLFIGYSDGTVLHLYLNSKNKASLHAPTLSELHELSSKELNALKACLMGQKQQLCFKNLKVFNSSSDLKKLSSKFKNSKKHDSLYLKTSKTIKHSEGDFFKTLSGKITGGNLSLISTSVGAFKFPSTEFLFLEDVNESAYKVDRLLHHLLYSGVLKSTQAILFGDFYPLKNKEFQEVLKSFSQSCSIPLVWGLPCGHSKRMPLAFNTLAKLSWGVEQAHLTVNRIKT